MKTRHKILIAVLLVALVASLVYGFTSYSDRDNMTKELTSLKTKLAEMYGTLAQKEESSEVALKAAGEQAEQEFKSLVDALKADHQKTLAEATDEKGQLELAKTEEVNRLTSTFAAEKAELIKSAQETTQSLSQSLTEAKQATEQAIKDGETKLTALKTEYEGKLTELETRLTAEKEEAVKKVVASYEEGKNKVFVTEAGTNTAELIRMIREVNPNMSIIEATALLNKPPFLVGDGMFRASAEALVDQLAKLGAKARIELVP